MNARRTFLPLRVDAGLLAQTLALSWTEYECRRSASVGSAFRSRGCGAQRPGAQSRPPRLDTEIRVGGSGVRQCLTRLQFLRDVPPALLPREDDECPKMTWDFEVSRSGRSGSTASACCAKNTNSARLHWPSEHLTLTLVLLTRPFPTAASGARKMKPRSPEFAGASSRPIW